MARSGGRVERARRTLWATARVSGDRSNSSFRVLDSLRSIAGQMRLLARSWEEWVWAPVVTDSKSGQSPTCRTEYISNARPPYPRASTEPYSAHRTKQLTLNEKKAKTGAERGKIYLGYQRQIRPGVWFKFRSTGPLV